jgi:hypothetical protein
MCVEALRSTHAAVVDINTGAYGYTVFWRLQSLTNFFVANRGAAAGTNDETKIIYPKLHLQSCYGDIQKRDIT